MASFSKHDLRRSLKAIAWPLRLTWAGMMAERLAYALWPLFTVVLLVLAALMLGLQDIVAIEVVWSGAVLAVLGAGAALIYALIRFRLPSRNDALDRLDASLHGRPIQALMDEQAIGDQDAASTAVWRAHQARMAERAAQARAVPAHIRTASRDPYALRYVAVLAFAVALIFGSLLRVGSVADMTPGAGDLATGPVWEGWIEPPRYTGKPALYLNDLAEGDVKVPLGSLITVRMYGEIGALTLAETVSARTQNVPPASTSVQDFVVAQSGELSINGPGGRTWSIAMIEDAAPRVRQNGPLETSALGEMTLPFAASDDYGIAGGEARFTLDLASVDRRFGLTAEPEDRPALIVPLPSPVTGDRSDYIEALIDDFSKHPWANLPVTLELSVLDAQEQVGRDGPTQMTLPGRRFFDPLAAAIVEMRRDLLWNRTNAANAAQVMRAVSHMPSDVYRTEIAALRAKKIIRRLETLASYGLTDEQQDDLAEELWGLALLLEEGDLADALARMERARERLEEAMKNGASPEEIEELMRELRQATNDYLRQLSRQAELEREQGDQGQQAPDENAMRMTQDDIQRMMDRIQELMEQGRMAEAEQALKELQEMLENMRVTQGQPGQGSSPGEQAMEGLAETLREQQGLSDQAFRDFQNEQFNPNAQAGESQGNEGRNGGQGRGQSHEGQGGQGQGEGEGQQGQQQGQQGQQGSNGQSMEQGLADRQRALRDELNRQQGNLPGGGTPEGDAARDALDDAGRAMDGAEEALRENDYAEAIDKQAQAMDALRNAMRNLGEAMQQEQQNAQPGQGMSDGDRRAEAQDPLGRESGSNSGPTGSNQNMLNGPDGARRAQELLDEIRRRSAEALRSEEEREYLKRLLERF